MATRSKLSHGVEVKSADKGEISAVIATLNVKDLDGDVATSDTFTEGEQVVISSYNHASMSGYALPVGKGAIRVTASEAILDGQFWMNMDEARNAFEVVKQMGADQDWSYGYKILEAERGVFDEEPVQFLKRVQVFEASPVIRGAGINTRTISVKGFKDATPEQIERARVMSDYRSAIRPHETVTTAKVWSLREAEAKLGDTPDIRDLRSMYAWCDPAGDPELKSSYRYPHHDGPGGPANLRACVIGIAKINGATMLGADIPDADRRGVYNHLAAHLIEADIAPSELSDGKSGALTFNDHQAAVLAVEQELIERGGDVLALRRGKGKAAHAPLSALYSEWMADNQKALRAQLDTPHEDAAREYARFVQSQLRLQHLN